MIVLVEEDGEDDHVVGHTACGGPTLWGKG